LNGGGSGVDKVNMKDRFILFSALAAFLAFAAAPARATDSHDYARDEYAIIDSGLAPNKGISLASHGEGEGGVENFHIWLMAEPAHRKIMALDNIGSNNNLDTGPKSYHAQWSADSRRVAVYFRSDRHVMQLNLYRIDTQRAHPIAGPGLYKEVTGREVDRQDDMRRSIPELTWQGPNRFRLAERRLFITSDAGFARKFGRYGKVEKLDDGRFSVEFSAEADCVLLPGDRYRGVDLRVGKFGE
jgi:hypothetical protein